MVSEKNLPHHAHPFSAGRPDRQIFQSVSTDDLPPNQRYDYWRKAVIRAAVLDEPSPAQRCDFRAKIVSLANSTSEFHCAHFDEFRARRSHSAARCDEGDDPSLFYFWSGTATVEEEGNAEFRLSDGDFMLFNPSRATTVMFGRSSVVQLDLPRQILQSRFGVIPSSKTITEGLRASPLTPMLKAQLDTLPRILGSLTAEEQMIALEATQALALTVLQAALDRENGRTRVWESSEFGDNRHLDLLAAAKRYIDENIAHPSLNADTVTRALQCSRSTLYRAFARQNMGIAEYIRDRRLERFRALLEQAHPATTIGDLAAMCGLYDAPNISRLFRARFGLSPSEFRSIAATQGPTRIRLVETF